MVMLWDGMSIVQLDCSLRYSHGADRDVREPADRYVQCGKRVDGVLRPDEDIVDDKGCVESLVRIRRVHRDHDVCERLQHR